MFKFSFADPAEDSATSEGSSAFEEKEDVLNWLDAEEVILFKSPFENNKSTSENMIFCGDFEIGTVNIAAAKFKDSDLLQEVEKHHSDLLPAKYEGGLKVWECTEDIGRFIGEQELDLDGKRVLDLGCGGGILGIIALECGAIVDFQDYVRGGGTSRSEIIVIIKFPFQNKEVIELFTIPNVCLNAEDEEKGITTDRAKFYCGDWAKFSALIGQERKYDLILTSETIYNPGNYDKLAKFFVHHLSPEGYVLLGAKGYYFGVGGSVIEFRKCLLEKYPELDCETVWTNETGVKREILRIKLKAQD